MLTSQSLRIAALAFVAVGLGTLQHAVADEEYVPEARMTTLHQDAIPGIEGKEMVVKHLAIDPEHVGGRHIHTGPVYVYVLEGELTLEIDGQKKTLGAGELYPEPLGTEMQAFNASGSDDLEILVIQVSDIGDPMMIKVE